MKKMLLTKMGIMLLIVSVFCLVPVAALTVDGVSFDIKMVADKTTYQPGDDISYKIWADVSGGDIDHCAGDTFILDPNIESISTSMPPLSLYPCSISGNTIGCSDPGVMMGLWFLGDPYHNWLPNYDNSGTRFGAFTISGKIKSSTPVGTTIKSTSSLACTLVNGQPIEPLSESDVTIASHCLPGTTCAPEFPSIFLPATMIIGVLGAVLLIQRTREN